MLDPEPPWRVRRSRALVSSKGSTNFRYVHPSSLFKGHVETFQQIYLSFSSPSISLTSTNDLDVRLGFDLCKEEREFLNKRKQIASQALKKALKLREELSDEEVCDLQNLSHNDSLTNTSVISFSSIGIKLKAIF